MEKEIKPEDILQIAQAFMECRILHSAAELNLFTILSSQPMSAQQVADAISGDARALSVLLDALAAMGLLIKDGCMYVCGLPVAALLSDKSPQTLLPMVLHMASLWKRWSRLTDIAKGLDEARDEFEFVRNPGELRACIAAMHSSGAPMAKKIAAAVDPGGARQLLDVGGGSGTYAIAFLRTSPDMKATLFDLPDVIEMARARLLEEGLLDRVTLVSGSYIMQELPGGHDLALLSAIIHSNSPEENLDLYRKIFRALKSGGRILIRDHVMNHDRTYPRAGALFAVNMLVGTSGGGTYTYEEIESGLAQAGFERIRFLKPGENMDALVEAWKP
jgi:SAM-dependent methyltransferase